jgi:hypothetical protein
MSWRNLLASIFGDFCGGSNCHIHTMPSEEIKHFERLLITRGSERNQTEPCQFPNSV